MPTNSPHQPTSLSDQITALKAEREELIALRRQITALGQTTSAAGTSTTYPSYREVVERIKWLDAQIEALTAQLNGEESPVPGIVLQQFRSGYL